MPNFDTFLLDKQKSSNLSFVATYIDNFSPWEDIVRKKVSKLRSIAELRGFDGILLLLLIPLGQGCWTHRLWGVVGTRLWHLIKLTWPGRLSVGCTAAHSHIPEWVHIKTEKKKNWASRHSVFVQGELTRTLRWILVRLYCISQLMQREEKRYPTYSWRLLPAYAKNFEYSGKWSDLSELEWVEHTKIVNISDTYGVKDLGGLQV